MGRVRRKPLQTATIVPYYRVSTTEQAGSGLGLEAQCRAVAQYAELYKLELGEPIEDPGESGKSLKRPGIRRIVAMMESGEAAGVIVAKLDRLTRSVRDLGELIDRFFGEKGGRQLVSVTEQIDTRSASGRLVLNVLASVGQWEREAIAERTRSALAAKRARGERSGSLPFGFELDHDDPAALARADGRPQRLRPNAAEQAALAEMLRLRARGATQQAVADELNRRRLACRGQRWTQSSVAKVLARLPAESPPGGADYADGPAAPRSGVLDLRRRNA